MAKQLNVNLAFSADTSQAQAAIRNLVNQLQAITQPGATANLPITKEILEAQVAAKRLGETLEASFNKTTGSLDLSSRPSTELFLIALVRVVVVSINSVTARVRSVFSHFYISNIQQSTWHR